MYKIKINRKKHTIKVQHVTRRVVIRGKAKRGLPGVGVPVGGTTGQILAKKSNTNYDTEWRNEQAALVRSVNGKVGDVVITKSDVGLANVDNTSDANKPVSSATQTALNTKANDSAVVHKTGNESISGTKTFADAPVVPTPTLAGHAANKAYVDSKGNAGKTVYLGDENDEYTVAKDDVLVITAANNVTVTLPTPDATWATHSLVIMNNSGFEATVIDHNGTPSTLGPMVYRVYGVIESNPGVYTWTWNGSDGIQSVEYLGSGQYAVTGPVDGVLTSRSISGDDHIQVSTDVEGGIQVKLPRMVWNVKESQFGALGDGVTDDTEAIQAAIDVAQFNGGGIVYLPAGTYSIDQTIGLQLPSGIHLMGAGMYATLLQLKDGVNVLDNIVKAESAGGIVLSDFSIDGQKSTLSTDKEESTNYGVYLADSPESRVERVRVYNMTGVGIHVYNSRAVVVRDCITSDNDYHGYEFEQTLDCVLDSNDAHGNVRHGLFVSPGEVGGTGAIGNVITNNMFYNNLQYGIAFGIDAAGGSIGLTRDNIVSNNTIRGNTDYGISIYQVDGVTVTGNLIEKSGKIGIYLYKAHRNIISNNRLIHNSTEGSGAYDEILLEGATDGDGSYHNMITDNWIETGAASGEPNANWAIREANVGDGSNIIKNNYIPWGGESGKVQVLNSNTTFELVGDGIENELSVRNFRQGLVVTPGADPGNGDMRIDAPFGESAFRMYTEVGNLQFVATEGNADWFIGGNNVFSVTDDYVTIHNYQIKAVATPTDGTDAANKDYVDAAVSGVPVGNFVLKAGDTMTGDLSFSNANQLAKEINMFSGYPSDDIAGGTDGTSRINLYSYQRGNYNSFGENIRHYMMKKDAKSMDTWYFPDEGYDGSRDPVGDMKPVVWTGAHWEANNHASNHKHWSVETPDVTGAIQTRFEVRWGDPDVDNAIAGLDKTLVMTNLADFVVRTSNSQMLRLSSPAGNHKPIEFNHDYAGGTSTRRWVLRANSTTEAGSNSGTDFQLSRYDDAGTFVDSPIFVTRSTGNVGIGTINATSKLTVNGAISVAGKILNVTDPTLAQDAATKNYVDVTVAALVDAAPGTLDTLNELAAALGDDPNFATTITTLIGTKANDNAVVHLAGAETITGIKSFAAQILPSVTATHNIGSASLRWSNIYAGTVRVNNATAIELGAGSNIVLDTATGTKIGTATSQKLAFYNATPIIQPVLATDFTYSVTNGTTDRTFDADALTMDEIADVLGTLSGDLVAVKTALKSLGLLA